MENELPSNLGTSWKEFAEEWRIGDAPGYSNECAIIGLDTLHRLWPDDLTRLIDCPTRGLGIIVPAIELGLLLRDCEHLDGFQPVYDRLRSGERGAYSELVLGSTLAALGFSPMLEPPLDEKVLDALCEVEGVPVYFEVVTPERPVRSLELQSQVEELTKAVQAVVSQCRVEVALSAPLAPQTICDICQAVQSAEASDWVEVNNDARVRRIDKGEPLRATFDGEGSQVIFAGERDRQGGGTNLIIRWEDTDERTQKLFNREYAHFSDGVANVLVVNVCAVPDGITAWSDCMARILRPNQNRKVGAVVLFEQGVLGPPEAIRRRWKVIINQYSHLSVPDSLLKGFEALDEDPVFFGKQKPARKEIRS